MKSTSCKSRLWKIFGFGLLLLSGVFLASQTWFAPLISAQVKQSLARFAPSPSPTVVSLPQAQPSPAERLQRMANPTPTQAELLAKAEADGQVCVIVGVRANFRPEGMLANVSQAQAQRLAIAQSQDALLSRMTAFNVTGIKQFRAIPFMALEIDAAALQFLQSSPEVSFIQEDTLHSLSLAESVPLIGAPAAWTAGHTGSGQTIAILDTGVDKTHPFLAGKVVSEACYSTTSLSAGTISACAGGLAQSTETGSGGNCNFPGCNHGTHVAGIAAGKSATFSGVAREANLISIQVGTRRSGCTTGDCVGIFTSDVIRGLERVYELRGNYSIAAVNLSLGGAQFASNCDNSEQATKAAIDNLRSVGIATIAASGNNGFTGATGSPACVSSAISVGSTGDGSSSATVDVVSSFSNSASFLHLLAPGAWINSSVPGGGFANLQGTSMAAPHVAGAWAVLKSKSPNASVAQILMALKDTGLAVNDTRNSLRKPRIRVDAAANALTTSACNYTIAPAMQSFPVSGGSGTVDVASSSGCAWTASSNVSWLTVTAGGTGTSNGSVNFTVAANTGLERTGTIFVAGQTYMVTQAGMTALAVDDGTFENVTGLAVGGSSYRVNRLTPTSYPATINAIAIYFPSGTGLRVGDALTVVAGAHPSGSETIDGIAFSRTNVTVQALDQFNVFPIPAVTTNSGDFVVGMQMSHSSGVLPFALDQTPPDQQRSYRSVDGNTFALTASAGAPGNYGIRAFPTTTLTCPTITSISSSSGLVGATVTITGTGFTGVTAVRFANNVTAQFTVNSDTSITTTVPTGAVTGRISLTKAGSNCADLQTAIYTVITCATVSGINPTSSIVGRTVRITGTALADIAAVKFSNGVTAQFTVNTAGTEITATVPAGAVTGPITLSKPGCPDLQTANFTVINCATITLTPETLPGGAAGTAYSQTLTASGGTAPYSFSVSSGLPSGLTLSSAGVLSGTPSFAGQSTFTVTATDANGCTGTRSYSMTFTGTPDLAMSKSHSGNFAEGSAGFYSLTVRNVGTAASSGTITVTDTLPNGLGYVSATGTGWSCSAAGQTVTCTRTDAIAPTISSTISLTVNVTAAAMSSVTNTATVANASDSNAANNSASDPTMVGCGYRLTPSHGQSFAAAGGTGTTQIETGSTCAWTATSSDSWITITSGASGTGNGTVNYTVAANTGTSPRTGGMTIAGQSYTIIQAGTTAACMVTPLFASGQGVNGTLSVNDCASIARGFGYADRYSFNGVSGQQVTILQESSAFDSYLALFDANGKLLATNDDYGSGLNSRIITTLTASGTYTIEATSLSSGTGNYTLSLSSMLAGCSYAVAPAEQSFEQSGGTGSFNVTVAGGCAWGASSRFNWITINGGSPGTGSGTVNFTIAPNPGGKRTGTIQVGGQSFTITQTGVPDSSFRGFWEGTTNRGGVFRFTVDENDMVTSLRADLSISFFVPPFSSTTCTYFMSPTRAVKVTDGQFEVPLTHSSVSFSTPPVLRVSFDGLRAASGSVSSSTAGFAICGNTISFGSISVSGVALTATRALVCPSVTGVTPTSALPGQSVKITGTNLIGVTTVKFGGNATAQFTVNNAGTEITATVPTGAMSGPITLSAPDCADVQTAAFTVIGCPTITLAPPTLPNGTVGTAYNQSLTASPAGTYTYAVTAGVLPAGLTLNASTGALTGTPTTAGTVNFTVTATGANNCSGSQAYTVTIAHPPPTLTTLNPASALVGSTGLTLTVTGTNFVTGAVVRWNGNDRPTTLVSSTQLTAAIPTSDLATAGSASVTVATTGGVSNALNFAITCSYAIAPTTQSFSYTGGTGTVTITTGNGCVWEATSDAAWLTITTSRSGTGSGSLGYSVAANTGGERTGSLTIAGQKLTITQARAPNPVASVNAASYERDAALAPDSIVSAFGQDLSTSDTGQSAPSGPLPTTLNGTTVKIKDSAGVEQLASLFYVAKTQVNYLMPSDAAVGAATVTITNGAGVLSVGTIQITRVAPGVFSANSDGKGLVIGSAIRVRNGIIVGEEQLVRYDAAQQKIVAIPLVVGQPNERVILQLYCTGLRHRGSLANVTVTIGGETATVEYAGAQPSFAGLDQFNVVVPPSLAGRGEVEIRMTVEGRPANVVTIHIA